MKKFNHFKSNFGIFHSLKKSFSYDADGTTAEVTALGKIDLTIVFDPFESFADGTTVDVDALGKNDSTIVFDPFVF